MDCIECEQNLSVYLEDEENDKSQLKAHLATCAECNVLVEDLRAIVQAARQLEPADEPSPQVWRNIEAAIERERLVHDAAPSAPAKPFLMPHLPLGFYRWAVAAVLAFSALAYLAYNNALRNAGQQTPQNSSAAVVATSVEDAGDQQLLQEVALRAPASHHTYQTGLRSVNNYIYDAKRAAAKNPNDAGARQQLMYAYEQKAALYEMAMARTAP
jgi:hypothetical protein